MSIDLNALGSRVRNPPDRWDDLGLVWTIGPVYANYGKPMTSATFESQAWSAEISVWSTGEVELEAVHRSQPRSVNKHYDLESAAALDTVLDELRALVRDNAIPLGAVTTTM